MIVVNAAGRKNAGKMPARRWQFRLSLGGAFPVAIRFPFRSVIGNTPHVSC
jgi:hypothetical protein